MSAAELLGIIPSAAWQGLTAIPQAAIALGVEGNRFAGAVELASPSAGNFWDPSSFGEQREGYSLFQGNAIRQLIKKLEVGPPSERTSWCVITPSISTVVWPRTVTAITTRRIGIAEPPVSRKRQSGSRAPSDSGAHISAFVAQKGAN